MVARDVVDHVVKLTAKLLREHGFRPKVARKDQLAAFRSVRSELERALADPATSAGSLNFLDAALSFDLPQHSWDLAKATGQDATMDAAFVQTAWHTLSRMNEGWWHWQRSTIRAYGPPVRVPDDPPLQDRVLGLLGRDPSWSA